MALALTGAKADEREVLLDILTPPNLVATHPKPTLIADKNYYGQATSKPPWPTSHQCSDRPARARTPRAAHRYFKPLRQIIESINDTLKSQLDLEPHGGRTIAGVASGYPNACSPSPPPSGTTTIGASPRRRSLTAYDH